MLIHGDSMRVLQDLDTTIDAVITDPPYGISYCSTKRQTILNDSGPYVWWLPLVYKLLKDNSCLLCFCRWDVQEAFRLAIEWAGFKVKAQMIWNRQSHGMGDTTGAPAPQHDVIWFAVKGRYKLPNHRPKSIVSIPKVPSNHMVHPTEKPIALLEELISSFTVPGELVLDPFAGSGSTCIAAQRLGRNYIGIELDPDHYAQALRRLAENSPT